MWMSNVIALENVCLAYGAEPVIENFSYTFKSGHAYTIIGPSGCGKTSLLYALAGLKAIDSGRIQFESSPHIAMVLQEYGLFPWKTVWQNIILGLTLKHKRLSVDQLNEAKEIARLLGLDDQLDKYPDFLSGGQKQRVAIARAWLLKPDILLMDEPFSALDTITRESLQNTIVKLSQLRSVTWITVTHNIEEAVFLGHEILLMSKKGGQIVQTFTNPDFGNLDSRSEPSFYAHAMQIRKAMQEVHHEA